MLGRIPRPTSGERNPRLRYRPVGRYIQNLTCRFGSVSSDNPEPSPAGRFGAGWQGRSDLSSIFGKTTRSVLGIAAAEAFTIRKSRRRFRLSGENLCGDGRPRPSVERSSTLSARSPHGCIPDFAPVAFQPATIYHVPRCPAKLWLIHGRKSCAPLPACSSSADTTRPR